MYQPDREPPQPKPESPTGEPGPSEWPEPDEAQEPSGDESDHPLQPGESAFAYS